ncbi:LysR family transcriptional regulator [Tannockella kyphosi]|uniref:LysR family transcriptional regulator n=1 Tax=Tannockella kyphosi TaxID=2899121 RepID=UPI00201288FF|nr:LysR family transcriptional regulator [Tannockella kyphosi]
MIDTRIYTFLELCKQMNYRKTAEALHITQPGVSQHIKYLENLYECTLFNYHNKILTKTKKCIELEQSARSILSLNDSLKESLRSNDLVSIHIGATRTIGDYVIDQIVMELLKDPSIDFHLTIDNTEVLLKKLNNFELDFLLLEGYIDKNIYDSKLISKEELVGICSKEHPFSNKEVSLFEIFQENIILREQGSGTRALLESFLLENNYSFDSFCNKSVINSYPLIEKAVENNIAISFVYDVIPKKNPNLATFRIKDASIYHEFNYVFLKGTNKEKKLQLLSINQ